jgi:hypothetical protein
MSLAGMAAVNCALLTKVVARDAPFQFTTEPETKPVPLAVSVNAAPPATAVAGETEARTGTGFVDWPPPPPSPPQLAMRPEIATRNAARN